MLEVPDTINGALEAVTDLRRRTLHPGSFADLGPADHFGDAHHAPGVRDALGSFWRGYARGVALRSSVAPTDDAANGRALARFARTTAFAGAAISRTTEVVVGQLGGGRTVAAPQLAAHQLEAIGLLAAHVTLSGADMPSCLGAGDLTAMAEAVADFDTDDTATLVALSDPALTWEALVGVARAVSR